MRHCAYFEMKIFIHFFIEIFLLKIKKKEGIKRTIGKKFPNNSITILITFS